MGKYKITAKQVTGAMLVLYLAVFAVLNSLTPTRTFSDLENRRLEQAPRFSLAKLLNGSFTADFEKYIADQFTIKDNWIGIKTKLEKLMGKREFNGVYLGKEDYLLQAFPKPTAESLEMKMAAINTFGAATPQLNKYLMLVPNAVEIYQDKLPPYLQTESQEKWLAQIKNSLQRDIKFVDVYDTLYAQKNEQLYYKTDHHWTTRAAFSAYQKFIETTGGTPRTLSDYAVEQASNSFYGSLYSKSGLRDLAPDRINLFRPKNEAVCQVEYFDEEGQSQVAKSLYQLDQLNKKDKYAVFLGGNHPLIKITTSTAPDKNLLVIKDSYANCLIPFLIEHYSHIFVVDLRYYGDILSDLIRENSISDVLLLYNVNTFFEDPTVESIVDYLDIDSETANPQEILSAANQLINFKEYFQQDVFMGDSITEAISYLGLLEPRNVCAAIGVNINEAKAQIEQIQVNNPRHIYLLFGVNDMDDRTPTPWFVEQYRELVRGLKQKYPQSQIYIQSVLPVSASLEQKKPHTNNKYISQCNAELSNLAEEEQVNYINLAALINNSNQDLYEADGAHFKAPFYNLWFSYLVTYLGGTP